MEKAMRQADRDTADRIAIERAHAAEARERALRSEVTRARTEAQAQVQAERAAETSALQQRVDHLAARRAQGAEKGGHMRHN